MRRVRLFLVAVLVAVGLASRPVAAQQPTQYDALRTYWSARSTAANERLKTFRRLVDSTNTDTAHALRFDIVSTSNLADMGRGVVRVADSLTRQTWLPPRPQRRAQFELRLIPGEVRRDAQGEVAGTPGKQKVNFYLRDADGSAKALTTSDSQYAVREAANMAMRVVAVDPALIALDPTLRQWMFHQPAAGIPSNDDFRLIWLELTTFPTLPARGCVVGEIRSCESALALVPEENPARTWYDPALRRVLAARWMRRFRERYADAQSGAHWDSTAVVRACESGHDDAACLRFLSDRMLGLSMIEPGPIGLRTLLVRYAFSFTVDSAKRADAAYAPGLTVQQRLAQASGLPFDELVRKYQQQLSARRPAPLAPSPTQLWATCLWCLGLGALGVRATRWRA